MEKRRGIGFQKDDIRNVQQELGDFVNLIFSARSAGAGVDIGGWKMGP